MNSYISELIKDYNGKDYGEFAYYVYSVITKKCEGKQKDKYIKIRNDVLRYIGNNKASISVELKK
jgi:hypothetical protein